MLLLVFPFVGCDKEQEADKVYLNGTGGTGGGGGGTGGGGGGGTGGALGTINGVDMVQGTVDGIPITIQASATIEGVLGSGGDIATPPNPSSMFYSSGFYSVATDEMVFEMGFGQLVFMGGMPDNPTFFNFFTPGTRPYGDPEVFGGVELSWWIAGDEWSTSLGAADQSLSTFEITDMQQVVNSFGTYAKIRATFTCSVYNAGGDVKTVTNGVLVLHFENM